MEVDHEFYNRHCWKSRVTKQRTSTTWLGTARKLRIISPAPGHFNTGSSPTATPDIFPYCSRVSPWRFLFCFVLFYIFFDMFFFRHAQPVTRMTAGAPPSVYHILLIAGRDITKYITKEGDGEGHVRAAPFFTSPGYSSRVLGCDVGVRGMTGILSWPLGAVYLLNVNSSLAGVLWTILNPLFPSQQPQPFKTF